MLPEHEAANSNLDVLVPKWAQGYCRDSGQRKWRHSWSESRDLTGLPEFCASSCTSGSKQSVDERSTSSAKIDDLTAASSTSADECAPGLRCGTGEHAVSGTCNHETAQRLGGFASQSYDSGNGPVYENPKSHVQEHHQQQCPSEALDRESSIGTPIDFELKSVSPALKEFEADPAHDFWTWDQGKEQWYHRDEETGTTMWCPNELD